MFRNRRIPQMNVTLSRDLYMNPDRLVLRSINPRISFTPRVSTLRQVNSVQYRLLHTDVESDIVDRVDPVPPVLETEKTFTTKVASSSKEAVKWEEENRNDKIMIYTDGSGFGKQVGAAAVMYRNGVFEKSLQFHLGPIPEFTSNDGELMGLLLGAHLLNTAKAPRRKAKILTDSLGTVTSLLSKKRMARQYIIDQILAWTKGHKSLTIAWIPRRPSIPGNKEADAKAKQAARGQSSNPKDLPRILKSANWKEKYKCKGLTKDGL
jgi:ribonuclease HI